MPDSPPPPPSTNDILLVEDDLSLAESVLEAFAEDSTRVTHVAHGAEALKLIAQQRFDLILLDLQLPGPDGFEILKRLRTLSASNHTPVIVLSAEHSANVKLRCFDLGAVDFLPKPYDLLELKVRARAHVRAKRKLDALMERHRQLEEACTEAEHSSKAKAGFLANMSHEIRTPMNGVIAMTGFLAQTHLDDEQRDIVDTIRTSGEALMAIINDVLNFSKIESGKLELEQQPLKLRSCIETTLDMLSSKAAEKHLEVLYRIDPQTPSEIIGDVTRLRQILVNLVGNAIKFTHRGTICVDVKAAPLADTSSGKTSLSTDSSKGAWQFHFTVSDTGVGIPSDKLPTLFQTFTQADSSIARQYGGTGLGLAISKGLVELMGGRIWAKSEVGRGSAFQFIIPLVPAGTADTTFTKTTVGSLRDLRALLLMESDLSSNLLAEQLQRWGMKTHCASQAKEVLGCFQAGETFDVILLDEEIQGTRGTELAKTIHTMPTGQNLPIILLSHLGKRGEASELLTPETTVCLNKPVKPESLQEGLLQILSRIPPTAKPSIRPLAESPSESSSPRIPLQILVTDDNVINLKVASRMLRQLGYVPEVAKTGLEAIKALEDKPYDIVLMDVQMPEMNGLEATKHIREQQQDPAGHPHFKRPIAIVAMTANAMPGDREKCLAAGMDEYVPKPVRPDMLEKVLNRLAEQISPHLPHARGSKEEKASDPTRENSAATTIPLLVPAESDDPVDVDRLMEFAGGGPENLHELIGLYVQQTESQFQKIQVALDAQSAADVASIAHSCAGASATCGMTTLVPLFRQLEQAGMEGNLQSSAKLVKTLRSEYQSTKKFLEDRFHFGASTIPKTIAL